MRLWAFLEFLRDRTFILLTPREHNVPCFVHIVAYCLFIFHYFPTLRKFETLPEASLYHNGKDLE